MPEIVLTDEQARVVAGATAAVWVRDPSGGLVGTIDPRDAEWIEVAKRRLAAPRGPGIPGRTVQAHLAALQAEWDRLGGFDREYALAFLAKLRAEGGDG
ncbi:MAG: hypothetical protein C0501_05880 [Isosphaera sp.]|nr:hypothetical protein [Isosphaera sp.]